MIPNKQEHSVPVVYLITCLVSGKIYVGSAKNFYKRYLSYQQVWKRPKRAIDHALAKYGVDQFVFSIMETVEDSKNLVEREQSYLDSIQPFRDFGYNICPVAGSSLGTRRTEESRRNISNSLKGKNTTPVVQIERSSLRVVAKYNSVLEASKAVKIGPTMIASVCSGRNVTAAGYSWCYQDEYDPKTYRLRLRKKRGGPNGTVAKPVQQLSLEGGFIRNWDHAEAAAGFVGIHPDGIRHVCKGQAKTAGGYKWSFVTDEKIVEEVNSQRKKEWAKQYDTTCR